MPTLSLRNIHVTYRTRRGGVVDALSDVSLDVEENTFVSLVGPSGCGKSTLLRVAAGLVRATAGKIFVDSGAVSEPGADRGMVFQSYTLFPWLTVRGNVEFGLRQRNIPSGTRKEIARSFIELVGLTQFESAYPKELSGGMMQRVAIARALANDPKLLLMDEPFGALDAQTRMDMQELLLDVWQRQPKTIFFVTHDVDEAILLGDRVCVMSGRPGRMVHDELVTFTRPRGTSLRRSAEFDELRNRLLTLIRGNATTNGKHLSEEIEISPQPIA